MANIPEYMRVRQYVVDMVMSHPNIDERIMSERELCKKFDVARITVRRALKSLVDDGWLYVKRGKGMFINAGRCRNNASSIRKFFKIMVIMNEGKLVHMDGFFMDVTEHLCKTFKRKPVFYQNVNLIGENGQVFDEISMYCPDGILWIRPPGNMYETIARLREKIPVCIVGNTQTDDIFTITMDYAAAGRLAAEWFIERGHEKVMFACHLASSAIKTVFCDAFKSTFVNNGIKFDEDLIIYESDDIVEKCKILMSSGIDAVFSFGSEYPAVSKAMDDYGKYYPVMIDENYFGGGDDDSHIAARLMIFPPKLTITAAEKIYERLAFPKVSCAAESIVFEPEIITGANK